LIEFVSEEVQKRAGIRFEKTISKKNTIFDAVVAEVAIELEAEYIFSFDSWYVKEGFKLAPEK
jgi:predicted nucleic acid-binding protein